MGKLDEKKKQKRDSLLAAAFALFTEKGINDTSISDIATEAKMAKGTFYLYFRDKFDIRDNLIASKATELFLQATEEMRCRKLPTLEEQVIYLADSIINRLNEDKMLLRFIAKNLSWGVFRNALLLEEENDPSCIRYKEKQKLNFAELNNMYMTGKDIDAVIKRVSFTVSEGINIAIGEAFMES